MKKQKPISPKNILYKEDIKNCRTSNKFFKRHRHKKERKFIIGDKDEYEQND